ncbi:hypothetical protein L804_06394 [Cryptococcus deuterogattii 2001/935-1]|nr:hypothetical protein L804_06394 [Cryptococcus deuterogattii 2001/935-1]
MAGGPYAHWWYGTDLDTRSESIWALKHAIGTSLGSIAFGSLLVTAIEMLHFVLKLLSGGHMAAFSLSWKIGSKSLINTSKLVGKVISIESCNLHFATGRSASYKVEKKSGDCSRRAAIEETGLILLYSFMLALNIGLSLTSALEAGVSTIFVVLDKDPEYLRDRNPRSYQDLACNPTYFQAVMLAATEPLPPNAKVCDTGSPG